MADFFAQIGNFFNDIFQNILNFLWDLLFILVELLFGWINIPPFPEDLKTSINSFFDLIFDNLTLLNFFIRPFTLRILVPLILIVFSFKYIAKIAIFVIKKIPFLGIK